MTLLKELIDIPERVHQGDFVLKLADGVDHAEQTLHDYVVTPQLVEYFDDALGFIRSAVESASSKAAYLHGSFGGQDAMPLNVAALEDALDSLKFHQCLPLDLAREVVPARCFDLAGARRVLAMTSDRTVD